MPNKGDTFIFIDNNQVIERKWHVEADYKSKSSVITTRVNIVPDMQSDFQREDNFSPAVWWSPQVSTKEVNSIITDIRMKHDEFNRYRDTFINDILKKIMDGVAFEPNSGSERYTFIESGHSGERPLCSMGEPIIENPCSYESVEKVFDDILSTVSQSKRSWAIVGCDALPYTIGHRVLENVHSCPSCHHEFLTKAELVDHANTNKHDCDPKLCRKYKHIMLVPGNDLYCYF
ncbi:uncharacterized protein [Magallana gigas]|uniref:uncharacterized protein isoform X1 n=2 Tax=Magallana gigas TaxID=29159 RepID=UPI00333F40EF